MAPDPHTDVLFLLSRDGNPYQSQLEDALADRGVRVIRADHTRPLPLLGHLYDDRPDVVHLHWVDGPLVSRHALLTVLLGVRLLFELVLCRLAGVRVVWTVHNLLDHERRHPRLELFFRRLVARLCDALVVHCSRVESEVRETYRLPADGGPRVVPIPHGHYVDQYENTVDRAAAREHFGIEGEETAFLFFGNIRPYKGVQDLVEGFRRLDGDYRLLVAGKPPADDDDRRRLVDACAADDRITTEFAFVADEDIQLYMNAADAVVLPFRHVLTSGSAVLAMSFGKPVVAPRDGCLPDTVAATDLLYDRGDDRVAAVADAMRAAADADLAAAGRRNLERARTLDWAGISADLSSLYREDAAAASRVREHPDSDPSRGTEGPSE